eukprot:4628698-Alexandrium_andersonii.AAC.1
MTLARPRRLAGWADPLAGDPAPALSLRVAASGSLRAAVGRHRMRRPTARRGHRHRPACT